MYLGHGLVARFAACSRARIATGAALLQVASRAPAGQLSLMNATSGIRSVPFAMTRGYCEVATEDMSKTQTSSSSTPAGSDANTPLAMNVAMAVNKIKRQHQQATETTERRKLELDAWTQLNSLSEEAIMTAEGKAVALLLNSWAYFSKHWQKGRDGPDPDIKKGKQPGEEAEISDE